jgi:hypothetical protein
MTAVSAELAAKHVGCSSAAQFRREVKQGVWPGPITKRSRPQRWSVPQLDAVLRGETEEAQTDPHLLAFEKRMGMAG